MISLEKRHTRFSILTLMVLPILLVMVPSTVVPVGACGVHVSVSPTSNSVPIGGTVVFSVTIKSSCGTDHIGWGPRVVSPTPVYTCDKKTGVCTSNGPVFHQGSYHVVGSGTQQFTASATNSTLMTTWTIEVVASDVTHCCTSDSATLTLTVNNFTVTANPTSISAAAGQTISSTITTSGQNGFAGTIYFSVNEPSYVCTSTPNGPVTLTPTNNSINTILTCSFPPGTFVVTVTGTPYSGVPSRTATITVTVK